MFGQWDPKNLKMFEDLLQIDALRGWDSTGAVTVKDDGDWYYVKNVGLPPVVLGDPDFKKEFTQGPKLKNTLMLLGHNRAATTGAVTIDNAHPFAHGDIVLVHNGTLISKYELEREYKGTFGTDSEAIAWSINEIGIEETYKKMDGAAVIVYWDDSKKRMCFLSNGKRSFFYAYTEGRKQMIFASEAWMIYAVAARNKVKIEKNKTFIIEPHLHWEWRMSRRNKVCGEAKKLVPFVAPVHKRPAGGAGRAAWPKREGNNGNVDYYEQLRKRQERAAALVAEAAAKRAGNKDKKASSSTGLTLPSVQEMTPPERWEEEMRQQSPALPWARSVGPHTGIDMIVGKDGKATIVEGSTSDDDYFTEPNLEDLREKDIDEPTFHKKYPTCMFCNESLQYEYEEAIILDDRHAACESCTTVARLNGIRMAV